MEHKLYHVTGTLVQWSQLYQHNLALLNCISEPSNLICSSNHPDQLIFLVTLPLPIYRHHGSAIFILDSVDIFLGKSMLLRIGSLCEADREWAREFVFDLFRTKVSMARGPCDPQVYSTVGRTLYTRQQMTGTITGVCPDFRWCVIFNYVNIYKILEVLFIYDRMAVNSVINFDVNFYSY